jgi:opine dehydrogenase
MSGSLRARPKHLAGSNSGRDAGGRPAIKLIDAERVAAAALGASVPTLADWFERVYGVRGATLVETCQRLTYNSDGPYQATGTPKSLDHKFITEDVPSGLIPMSALGAAAGVRTPLLVRSFGHAADDASRGRDWPSPSG